MSQRCFVTRRQSSRTTDVTAAMGMTRFRGKAFAPRAKSIAKRPRATAAPVYLMGIVAARPKYPGTSADGEITRRKSTLYPARVSRSLTPGIVRLASTYVLAHG
jgi:hypothetical protein